MQTATHTAARESSDAALVLAARAGDTSAGDALVSRHYELAFGLAKRILAGRGDADEVAQDAFFEVFRRLDRLREPQAFAAWLGAIVVRRASKFLRRHRLLVRLGVRAARVVEPDTLVAPTATPDIVCELRAIGSFIMSLPAPERAALLLRRVEGRELAEIADHMQLSLATVKRRLLMAEARLEREFERAPRLEPSLPDRSRVGAAGSCARKLVLQLSRR
ncbi:MAG TPA: sigma-70 family RNA polymerase sigma factor [Polyangiaceae bacterium]|nr:sigma-70 family RNA polymerase sigma factor [Polyangiaceae bacterium]